MDIGELNRRVEILKENRTGERNGVFHGAASLGRDGHENNYTVLCGLGCHAPDSLRR